MLHPYPGAVEREALLWPLALVSAAAGNLRLDRGVRTRDDQARRGAMTSSLNSIPPAAAPDEKGPAGRIPSLAALPLYARSCSARRASCVTLVRESVLVAAIGAARVRDDAARRPGGADSLDQAGTGRRSRTAPLPPATVAPPPIGAPGRALLQGTRPLRAFSARKVPSVLGRKTAPARFGQCPEGHGRHATAPRSSGRSRRRRKMSVKLGGLWSGQSK